MSNFDPNRITYFGATDYRNKQQKFGIKAIDRTKHVYVIGKTGMGKSTLLENMAVQDIANGEGFAFIDPHGSTAETLLDYIPEHRVNDVLYFAPFDLEHPISFNVMEDVGEDKRHLVAAGLMSAFKKIWVDAWSARMEYILNNTILALLEYPDSTLLGINRVFADKAYRKRVVRHITDPAVRSFWVDEFANYTDRFAAEATPAIQNKVGQFTSNPVIRNIIGQPKSSFDMRKMMDERKIIIINLSKGQVGEDNANLLGSMIITKLYLAAMSRADLPREELNQLPNFYLYVDEFQSFANESFANILSEARKYKLNLTIAHQYIEQMSDEVRAAVFGNVGTMITFRVGAYDAEVFEKEFAPQFTAEDIVNLGRFQMYLKLMIEEVSSSPFSASSLPPIEKNSVSYRDMVIASSRTNFSKPRPVVEEEIVHWHEAGSGGGQQQSSRKGVTKNSTPKFPPISVTPEMASSDSIGTSDREAQVRKAMSLDHLKAAAKKKKKKKKNKGPSTERVNELKEALSQMMVTSNRENASPVAKKKQVRISNTESDATNTQSDQRKEDLHTPPPARTKEKQSQQQPDEVPESVLKKLMEMEG